jgi:hypothetical protein
MDEVAYLFVVLISAMLLGLITGAIAQKKGDSFVAWWLFGTFLFIVALPMVLLMEGKAGARGMGTKKCPYCGAAMKTNVMECPECRRSQPEIGAATNASWQRIRTADDDVAKWAKEHGVGKNDEA